MSYGVRRKFYNSKLWKQVKNNVWLKQNLLCNRCGKPVYVDGISEYIPKEDRIIGIVHHKEYLTEANLEDDLVAINEDNLEGLCIDCHNDIHKSSKGLRKEYKFDEYGNIVKRE